MTLAALEQRLHNAHVEQLRHYERALDIVANPLRLAGTTVINDWVHDLNAELNEIAAINTRIAGDKRAWAESGQRPGRALQSLLDVLAERIRELGQRVDGHIADLQAHRHNMLPEIDDFIRQRRMLQAYGKR
jgi:hypothetical protein